LLPVITVGLERDADGAKRARHRPGDLQPGRHPHVYAASEGSQRSIKITERHYAPWAKARQEQLEAEVRRIWNY
jgi:hypothetical protein